MSLDVVRSRDPPAHRRQIGRVHTQSRPGDVPERHGSPSGEEDQELGGGVGGPVVRRPWSVCGPVGTVKATATESATDAGAVSTAAGVARQPSMSPHGPACAWWQCPARGATASDAGAGRGQAWSATAIGGGASIPANAASAIAAVSRLRAGWGRVVSAMRLARTPNCVIGFASNSLAPSLAEGNAIAGPGCEGGFMGTLLMRRHRAPGTAGHGRRYVGCRGLRRDGANGSGGHATVAHHATVRTAASVTDVASVWRLAPLHRHGCGNPAALGHAPVRAATLRRAAAPATAFSFGEGHVPRSLRSNCCPRPFKASPVPLPWPMVGSHRASSHAARAPRS